MRWRAQEVAFSASMAVVAVFSRDNPQLVFPNVLWAFAALLAFNLAYHVALRRRGEYWAVPLVSMAVNMLLIAVVLTCSGGPDSYFWPMYLLPVFTACLYLEPRHVALAVAASTGFLACFYLDLAAGGGPAWRAWELVVKAGVLILAGWTTSQLSLRERVAQAALEAAQGHLDALASAQAPRGRARNRLWDGVLFDVYSQLTALTGSAEIMRDRLPGEQKDLSRMERSIRSLKELVGELLRLSDEEGDEAEVDLASVLRGTLTLVDYKARYRNLWVRVSAPRSLRIREDRVRLQQSLLELLQWLTRSAKPDTQVSVTLSDGELTLEAACAEPPDGALRALFAARGWALETSESGGRLRVRASFSRIRA